MHPFLELAHSAWQAVLSEFAEQGWRLDIVTPVSRPEDADAESTSDV